MNTCHECKHWIRDNDDYADVLPEQHPDHSVCRLLTPVAKHRTQDAPAWPVADDRFVGVWFVTRSTFGCNQFAPLIASDLAGEWST